MAAFRLVMGVQAPHTFPAALSPNPTILRRETKISVRIALFISLMGLRQIILGLDVSGKVVAQVRVRDGSMVAR